MFTHIAFIRGINVGGNCKLPMKDLIRLCEGIGFKDARTYINSGNVLFKSSDIHDKEQVKNLQLKLEETLLSHMKRNIAVVILTVKDVQRIVNKNPFPQAVDAQLGVLLFSDTISKKLKSEFIISGSEEISIGKQEVYIHYPDGMGRSKLKIPTSLTSGTMRNMNTLKKLVDIFSVIS